jgi:hypothetical protein
MGVLGCGIRHTLAWTLTLTPALTPLDGHLLTLHVSSAIYLAMAP